MSMIEKSDEEIYNSYIAGQETRSKDNLLKMMAAVRTDERKTIDRKLKEFSEELIEDLNDQIKELRDTLNEILKLNMSVE